MKKIIAARMFSRVSILTSGDHLTDAIDPSRKILCRNKKVIPAFGPEGAVTLR
jgi:hypothetical protein